MSTKHMENLSDLPCEMLIEIAKLLKKPKDFTFFRSVSKSLSTAVKEEYFDGLPFRQGLPYLMLPVREDDVNTREFYSLVEGESIVTSFKIANFKTKKCFESLGWLLVVEEDGRMSLLDPFSGTEIPVPHQNTFPGNNGKMNKHIFIQKMMLSSRPSKSCDFVLMIIAGGYGHLGYWRLGDKAWNKIEDRQGRFRDVVYGGGGQFYAVGNMGKVWVFNFMDNNNGKQPRIINCSDYVSEDYGSVNLYIHKNVDDESLLMIVRTVPELSEDDWSYETIEFEVYEVDIRTGTCKEIDSLGNMALFLGENSTIVVDASRLSGGGVIKPNHIYFTDDNWEFYTTKEGKGGGADIGVYNLETGDIEPIYPGEPLLNKVSPSTWITPCF